MFGFAYELMLDANDGEACQQQESSCLPLSRRALLAGSASVAAASVLASPAAAAQQKAGRFRHPGLLFSADDLKRLGAKVNASASPWIDGWQKLMTSGFANVNWQVHPVPILYRNSGVAEWRDNYIPLCRDIMVAYACALRWHVLQDRTAADCAVRILNGWSSTLTLIYTSARYHDGQLLARLQGYEFANVGELLRGYDGWASADFERFKTMMCEVFLPHNGGILNIDNANLSSYANWELAAVAMVMAVGVLCDDAGLFQKAVDYFKRGAANGSVMQAVYFRHPGNLGQTQEAGRDQGHNTLVTALMAPICQMAWNQGVDLFGYDNNRVLAGAEYVAKANSRDDSGAFHTVPFQPYQVFNGPLQAELSTGAQGIVRPAWAIYYNHYVRRKGIAAPYVSRMVATSVAEGGPDRTSHTSGAFDQIGYGTLLLTDTAVVARAPSGLTAAVVAGAVQLDWWGMPGATGYTLWRSGNRTTGFTSIATGISDVLTYVDTPPSAGVYFYRVTATTGNGESKPSDPVVVLYGNYPFLVYDFAERRGPQVTDRSGLGLNGALYGGASRVAGRNGQALGLSAAQPGWVQLPSGVVAHMGDLTVAAWVYWNGGDRWQRIFDFGWNTTKYMYLSPAGGSRQLQFGIALNGYKSEQGVVASKGLPTGQWCHVAVTMTGKEVALYLNGEPVAYSDAISFPPLQLAMSPRNYIGRSQFPADPAFNGMIDSFRLIVGAVGQDEVKSLMQST
ncbi:LamG-like jellyroll fold domain-containing protein [Oryzibacter oryziterrae]|uniref:LamG-like jellyroll fold domain-containing protein n=1 Tax=Oryzibacter oryziterrae TaxID=2766474 RepID=UPI001F00DE80|nr:LamG-like jellyroll fold domain-containing protein [Oryzibacter oryziterrae]